MSDATPAQPPGWYKAQGDPPGTQRYWDGEAWQGGPQPIPGAGAVGSSGVIGSVGSLAEPQQRMLARLIDGAVWFMIAAVLPNLIGSAGSTLRFVTEVIGGLAIVAYEVLMVSQRGATLGKMVIGLKVVDENGEPADQATALRRMFLFLPFVLLLSFEPWGPGLFALVALAGLVMLFTDERRRTPWDQVGKTLVVEG
jgi:uncharacterized RDD family membrane protein YckC